LTGGGNVGLREVLGPDAVSVPPPPPRLPKAGREEQTLSNEAIQHIDVTDQVYCDIHTHLNKDLNYQVVVQRLMAVCRQIEQACFLALEEVVLGGAAGKGLLTVGPAAEIVLFVKQLPYRNFPQWLPHILDTLAPVFENQLASLNAERFKVEKDHLRFYLSGGITAADGSPVSDLLVQVYLSPVFKSAEHRLECIRHSPPAERSYFHPALVKERNDFIGRQPQRWKVLIRLMTWWISKQVWSSRLSMPSDWLVELLVVHTCQAMGHASSAREESIAAAVAKLMEALSSLETAKVLWTGDPGVWYSQEDIWKPLLSHEPLFMDPLNPFSNLTDASVFDVREVVAAAQAPSCFNTFKREAAKWLLRPVEEEDEDGYDENEAHNVREEEFRDQEEDDDGDEFEDALED